MSIKGRLCRGILGLFGWKCRDIDNRPIRAVVIGYPHTSNWDFIVGILTMNALDLNAKWAGKDSLFWGPMGWFMKWLGGIPVNRRDRTGLVSRLADQLRHLERFNMIITPEGTRSYTEGWKTGFYRLALMLDVPVLCGVIDFEKKETGIIGCIKLSGNMESDLQDIAVIFEGTSGKFPHKASPIRFLS